LKPIRRRYEGGRICGTSLQQEGNLAELHVKTQEEENGHTGHWSDTVGIGQVQEDLTDN
jgi:hypothetical protein